MPDCNCDFEYWLTGIIGTCKLMASKETFWRSWVLHDTSITSIYSYDELYEQLAGDLHMDDCIHRFEPVLRKLGVFGPIVAFANAVHRVDESIERNPELQSSEVLLSSQQWADLQAIAEQVTKVEGAQKYLVDHPVTEKQRGE